MRNQRQPSLTCLDSLKGAQLVGSFEGSACMYVPFGSNNNNIYEDVERRKKKQPCTYTNLSYDLRWQVGFFFWLPQGPFLLCTTTRLVEKDQYRETEREARIGWWGGGGGGGGGLYCVLMWDGGS